MNATTQTPREAAPLPARRLLLWSIRRELWENRAIYLAPLGVAGVMLLGFLLSAVHLPDLARAAATLDPQQQADHLIKVYGAVAIPLILVSLAVAAFYCLDALHGERRDRSILFWKSLPVSDLLTVLAKAAIPMLVLPLITFAIVVVLQSLMRLLTSAVLLANGISAAVLWTQLPLFQLALALFYGLLVLTLWQAPVYAWMLLISAWAKRNTFLWATLPPLALSMAEKIAFDSHHIGDLLSERLFGGLGQAFDFKHGETVTDPLQQLQPARFLFSPGLWLGLIAAAAMLAGAVRLRRSRQPL